MCLHLNDRLGLSHRLLCLNSGLLSGLNHRLGLRLCHRLCCRLGSGRTAISAERLAFIYQRTA